MTEQQPFSVTGRYRSVRYALRGLRVMLMSQHNAWIHAAATCLVGLAGAAFRLTTTEWCLIVLATMAVWTAEALNTAFEFLTDIASPSFHPVAEKAKDVAAGAVLITALGAALVGLLVLGPHLWEQFRPA